VVAGGADPGRRGTMPGESPSRGGGSGGRENSPSTFSICLTTNDLGSFSNCGTKQPLGHDFAQGLIFLFTICRARWRFCFWGRSCSCFRDNVRLGGAGVIGRTSTSLEISGSNSPPNEPAGAKRGAMIGSTRGAVPRARSTSRPRKCVIRRPAPDRFAGVPPGDSKSRARSSRRRAPRRRISRQESLRLRRNFGPEEFRDVKKQLALVGAGGAGKAEG